MKSFPKRVNKSWSTRQALADKVDNLAKKYEDQWGVTFDRSKVLNALCNAFIKAEPYLDKIDPGSLINEETLEAELIAAICKSRP